MKKYFACFGLGVLFFSVSSYAQPAAAKPGTPAIATTAASVSTPFLPPKIAGTVTLKAPAGVAAQANGLKAGTILVSVDTTIHSNPHNPLPDGKMAYLSIDISNLTGTNEMEVASGKLTASVYDKAGKPIVIADQILKRIKAAMEGNNIDDMMVKIPYRLKTDPDIYTIHFRWESPDKSRNIDIVTTK